MKANKQHNQQQAVLEGIVQTRCHCGCGHWFMAAKTKRPRLYLNDTHKKRAARARDKERRTETTVKLTPKGWLYWYAKEPDEVERLWRNLSHTEQQVIQFLCDTGMEPYLLRNLVITLFGMK